ncbi:HAD-IA family hydrolase [Synechococcus sp. HB1133]|uniref:HAD-IA family hydrolase n=1 Tax=unclassified Synechococcus TaxID=2626047 RepID=UPI001409F5A6|nr:HAD-IA family hydrolase [Synechococcus sp. HB1133]MCB4430214.1 HAD-IA family hydrolase [Synechococcus sp. HBA1120]NHI80781.1 HAD family hydrolase [Synechococcus sp. HB1133]
MPLLVIKLNRLSAVFWDVDGTLADTEMDGHRPAFNTAFEELNLPFHWDEVLYNTLLAIPGGLRRVKIHAEDRGVMLSQDQLEQVRDRKRLHYLERVRQGNVKLRPGVRRLLEELNLAGVQQWIVTSSGSASVMALLEQIQNDIPHFDGVVTSDDVSAGKPAPDGYLLALRRSGADGAASLAVEDSAAGLSAATAAGLRCLLTPSPWDASALRDASKNAAAVLDHLGESGVPATVRSGPTCQDGTVTLKYLETLLSVPDR